MTMWDLVQRAQIKGLQRSAALADNEHLARTRRQDERADRLEDRIDQLSDMLEALWDVLSARHGLTDHDLEVALGIVHERRAELARPVKCFKCGAAVLRSEPRCQFCGTERFDDAPPVAPTTF